MESATIHILHRKKYYDVNELVDICPQIFNGCKNGFEFVHMANIKYEKYIFDRTFRNADDKLCFLR